MNNQIQLTATHFNYYFICKRKLWFFAQQIQCEQESELVAMGKLIHEASYADEKKEFEFEGIKVDWLDLKNQVVHEVKKSDKVEDAHLWQLKYYLYYFRKNNFGDFTGEINYPKLRKTEKITLSDDDIANIELIEKDIIAIINNEQAPKVEKVMKICKSCSYFELCWI